MKVFLALSDFISAYGEAKNTLSVLQSTDLLKISYSFTTANMNAHYAKKILPSLTLDENYLRGPVFQ